MADVDQVTDWLEQIIRHGRNTSAWEDDFVNKMQSKIDAYGERAKFTDNEAAKVEEIYVERVP